jgi:hypothetical protein
MHILQKHEPKDDTRTARSFTTWHCRFGVLARSEKVLFQINAVLFDLVWQGKGGSELKRTWFDMAGFYYRKAL